MTKSLRWSWMGVCLSIAHLASGCETPPPSAPPADLFELTESTYCDLVTDTGDFQWHGNLLTRCSGASPEADDLECQTSQVDTEGALTPLELSGVREAWPLAEGMLLWLNDGMLLVRANGLDERLSQWALDPSYDPTGNRAVWIGMEDGGPEQPGGDKGVMMAELSAPEPQLLSDDVLASNPVMVPGTAEAIITSTVGGMASIWRVGYEIRSTQLTNLEHRMQTFVPPLEGRSVWSEGRLVFGSNDTLFELDAETGAVRELGPGTFPMIGPNDSVLALAGDDCPTTYGSEGAQP